MDYIKKMRSFVGHECLQLVAANIIFYDDKKNFYFQQRRGNKRAFFGGLCEIDENIVSGLIREVKEETNLEINVKKLEFFGVYNNHIMEYPNGDKVKPCSFFFKYKLEDNEKLECVEPETVGIFCEELSMKTQMLNIQHENVRNDLMENKGKIIIN